MSPTLAPRRRGCLVCRAVADTADLNVRLIDDAAARRPGGVREAVDYLRGIGSEVTAGNPKTVESRVRKHREHVELWVKTHPGDGTVVVAPMHMQNGASRIEPLADAGWLSLQQTGMNLGRDAMAVLADRLEGMEDKELIATAKLGMTAAAKRADMEAKGKHLSQVDALIRLAAGMSPE